MRSLLALSTALGLILPIPRMARAQVAAPPARVGQIALLRGSVSFSGAGTGGWAAAQLNYPVIAGDALYTQPGAEAAIALDWSRITLAGRTEFAVSSLDERTLRATESQGEIYLDLRYLPRGDRFVIATPRGTVTISRDGRYDIIAGDQNSPTEVTALSGLATVNGQDVALTVRQGETAVLDGADPVSASLGGARRDAFMDRMERAYLPARPAYAPPVVD
ncbi:MAG TPA: FecR domain-containing protein, partial [Acetobacteraceae bacterium]|nr:FecR domain-containing protein [Acetobacteraceae bacterium]